MLGPARFRHIELCAQEVCRAFKKKEDLEDCVLSLKTLDDRIADLREEINVLPPPRSPSPSADNIAADGAVSAKDNSARKTKSKPDYSSFTVSDLPKARRLLVAREKTLASLHAVVAKRKVADATPLESNLEAA